MVSGFRKIALIKPRSVGERLHYLRLRRKLMLGQLEEQTKVRAFFIEALEKSQFDKLPATVYCLGFLRSIAQALKVPFERFEADFKAERELWLKIRGTNFDHFEQIKAYQPRFVISPRLLAVASALATVMVVTAYIYFQVASFLSPPILDIFEPADEAKVEGELVKVVGKTSEGATVMINREPIVPSSNGSFEQEISLTPGINELEISAQSRFNKKTTKNIKVLRSRSQAGHEANQTGS